MQFTDIIWDFDGTLFDTYPVMARTLQRALKEEGIKEPYDEVMRQIKVTVTHALEHFKEKYNLTDRFNERYKALRDAVLVSESAPVAYIEEVCRKATEKGIRNFIFTHRGETVFEYLTDRGMSALFTDVVSKGKTFQMKPDPQGFLYIIEKHGLNKAAVLAVGDRDIDILAGENAGVKTCLYLDNETTGPCKPDYVIHSMKEIMPILGI